MKFFERYLISNYATSLFDKVFAVFNLIGYYATPSAALPPPPPREDKKTFMFQVLSHQWRLIQPILNAMD